MRKRSAISFRFEDEKQKRVSVGETNDVLDHSNIEPIKFVVLSEEAEGTGGPKTKEAE